MPWQSAPPLIIIGGAFCLTGLLLNGVDRLTTGKNRRVQIDEFVFNLDKRDKYLAAQQKIREKEESEEKKLAEKMSKMAADEVAKATAAH